MENNKQNGKFIIALGRAMQHTHRESTVMLRENGLTSAQFTALEALYHKGELTVQQIIDAVLGSSGNMTVVIRNLEQQGLVQRLANPVDRRSFLIGITDAGRELMDTVFPLHMELLGKALTAISEEEKASVINILKKLHESEPVPNGRK